MYKNEEKYSTIEINNEDFQMLSIDELNEINEINEINEEKLRGVRNGENEFVERRHEIRPYDTSNLKDYRPKNTNMNPYVPYVYGNMYMNPMGKSNNYIPTMPLDQIYSQIPVQNIYSQGGYGSYSGITSMGNNIGKYAVPGAFQPSPSSPYGVYPLVGYNLSQGPGFYGDAVIAGGGPPRYDGYEGDVGYRQCDEGFLREFYSDEEQWENNFRQNYEDKHGYYDKIMKVRKQIDQYNPGIYKLMGMYGVPRVFTNILIDRIIDLTLFYKYN